jgi:RecA/RadA recombinase
VDVARTTIEWMNSGIRVVMIDSVGGMSTRYQHDRIWGKEDKEGKVSGQHEFGDQRTGHFAGVLTDAVKEIRLAADLTNSLVIILNQIRDNIGAEQWEDDETTPGGRALKHESSLRLRVSRVEGKDGTIREDGDVVGNYARVYVAKSRVSPPYRKTGEHTPSHLAIFYDGRELDESKSLTVHAAHLGLITRSGSWYSYEMEPDNIIKAQGADAFSEQLRSQGLMEKLRESVIVATREKMSISEVENISGFEGLDNE